MFPLDDLGHSQHHIHSIHLFYTGISHMTRKKKKDKHKSVGSTLLQSSVFCVYTWGERMIGSYKSRTASIWKQDCHALHKTLYTAVFHKHKRTSKAHSTSGFNTQHRGARVTDDYVVTSFAMVQCHLVLPCPMKSSAPVTLWLLPVRVMPAPDSQTRTFSRYHTWSQSDHNNNDTDTHLCVCVYAHIHVNKQTDLHTPIFIYYLSIYI